ncbi:hypothetical protein [Nonomuraea recticatena]|uniref:Uncharacterized protein n=1 Tax=Nonomuraea recticatena TaxID=46178 RepID=A0ABP6EHV4_9ACTN
MAEFSYPFDSGDGSAINEDQWSFMTRSWQDNGVEASGPSDTALKVSSQTDPLTLLVQPGHAFLSGFHFHLTALKSIFFADNASSNPRADRVVLRLNRELNKVTIEIKQGIPSSSPTPPPVDRSWETPEVPLATFIVRGNSNAVAPVDVTDNREYVGRRMRVDEGTSGHPAGTIAYQPSLDRWNLVKGSSVDYIASGAELASVKTSLNGHVGGADPHSMYYTASRGDARWAAKSHAHSMTYHSANASIRTENTGINWHVLLQSLICWGRVAQLSLIIGPPTSQTWGVASGQQIALIDNNAYRPVSLSVQATAWIQSNNSSEPNAVSRIAIRPDGLILFEGATYDWKAYHYLHLHVTYICNGISPW